MPHLKSFLSKVTFVRKLSYIS